MEGEAVGNFIKYFSMVAVLITISIVGVVGLFFLLKNMERRTRENGDPVVVVNLVFQTLEAASGGS